jgi:hypothetical protein
MTDPRPETAGGKPRRHSRVWSIGIYAGVSPLHLAPAAPNPVLEAKHIFDANAFYVADPFLLRADGLWHIFFEVLLRESKRGVIGLATSRDALAWNYQGIVLEESWHLSYPQVFAWRDNIYMLPETLHANAIRLYRATAFPKRFEPAADLWEGQWADPTFFQFNGRCWLLACSTPHENRTLHLFFADDLFGPWRAHPQNPIVADDRRRARPGGRVQIVGNRLIRFAQDCVTHYGALLRAYEITELSPDRYQERECAESPVLEPSGAGWNSNGMHHMDAHALPQDGWIACVDGDQIVEAPLSA